MICLYSCRAVIGLNTKFEYANRPKGSVGATVLGRVCTKNPFIIILDPNVTCIGLYTI